MDPEPQPHISYAEVCKLRGFSSSLSLSVGLSLCLCLLIFSVSLSVSVCLSVSLSLSFPPRGIHSSPKPNCTLAKAGGTVATPGYILEKKAVFKIIFKASFKQDNSDQGGKPLKEAV